MILLRIRHVLKVLIPLTTFFTVALIELQFQRPLLSVRPQLWQSKPVDWLFEIPAEQMSLSTNFGSDQMLAVIEGYAPTASRSKNGGGVPLQAPLATHILFSTLDEMDRGDTQVQIKGFDLEGSFYEVEFEAQKIRMNSDEISFEIAQPINDVEAISQSVSLLFNIDILINLSVQACPPRESLVVCPFADFAGADLSRGDFDRANLRGADFTRAVMVGTKLGGADLSGSVLRDVNLSRAWLVAVDLGEAHLERVIFDQAIWTR